MGCSTGKFANRLFIDGDNGPMGKYYYVGSIADTDLIITTSWLKVDIKTQAYRALAVIIAVRRMLDDRAGQFGIVIDVQIGKMGSADVRDAHVFVVGFNLATPLMHQRVFNIEGILDATYRLITAERDELVSVKYGLCICDLNGSQMTDVLVYLRVMTSGIRRVFNWVSLAGMGWKMCLACPKDATYRQ